VEVVRTGIAKFEKKSRRAASGSLNGLFTYLQHY